MRTAWLAVVALVVFLGSEVQTPAQSRLCLADRTTGEIAAPKAAATIAQASWIAGVWVGTERNTTIEERWTPPSGGVMLGSSRTMPNGTMTSFEFLCIVEKGGTLVYQAMPNGRSPATDFTATAVTADSITFENPAHDFPKMIRYARKADGSLETTIAGEGGARARSFVLKRQE